MVGRRGKLETAQVRQAQSGGKSQAGHGLRQAGNTWDAGSPAFCSVSMFWGLVASSATICTNCVRAFWYCSNTEERDPVEPSRDPCLQRSRVPARPGHTLQHLPLAHGEAGRPGAAGPQVTGPLPPPGLYQNPFLCVYLSPGQPTQTGCNRQSRS